MPLRQEPLPSFARRLISRSAISSECLRAGGAVGRFHLFDEPLLDAMNVALQVARLPGSLAYLNQAAGPVTLLRCGAILDERLSKGSK